MLAKPLSELSYSIKSGSQAFEKIFGMPLFAWLAKHPLEASMFSETMVEAVAKAYDFSQAQSVIDIGGATGNLLAAILSDHHERAACSSTCRM